MRSLSYVLVLALGIGCGAWYFAKPGKSESAVNFHPKSPLHAGLGAVPSRTSKQWPEVFQRLGIKAGDLITEVDGKRDSNTMMQRLINGYNNGHVCVRYEANTDSTEICLSRAKNLANQSTSVVQARKPALDNEQAVDLNEILQGDEASDAIKNGLIPLIKDGKFKGWVRPEQAPPSRPTRVEFGRPSESVE